VIEGQLPESLASVLERQEAERDDLRERLEGDGAQ
jgi:hypothetical protein